MPTIFRNYKPVDKKILIQGKLGDGVVMCACGLYHSSGEPPGTSHLLTFAGRSLIGPVDDALWPFVESIRWHRREVFRRR